MFRDKKDVTQNNSPQIFVNSAIELVDNKNALIVRQIKEWMEIFTDWETRNKYEILTEHGERVGLILEKSGGFWSHFKRLILRSHRPLEISVFNISSQILMKMTRDFFFFFSDLYIKGVGEEVIGSVHRRFGLINKKYDLYDNEGRLFARVRAPIWRLWTFPIYDARGRKVGVITKKWQGLLKEVFTDADQYLINYDNGQWTNQQRAVILAAAISVDFDFFENNQGKSGGLLGD